ncbi:MAG: Tol-pal system beta propeller repeat protein [Deltaproteobacteria bacterium]|nr:Tol-pal system beta propeller repeat protein [Deltaproteobacteria bacterium]
MNGAALVALVVLALAACKGGSRAGAGAGSNAAGSSVGSNTAGSNAASAPAIDPRVSELPGELWFVDDGPPHRLVRFVGGKRLAIEAPLFPSTERLPDGRLVAIRSRGDGSPDSEQLVLVAPDGTQTPLGPAAPQVRDPVADPRGAWIIAALQLDGHSELHRVDVATGTVTQLTDNKEGNFHPVGLGADAIAFVSSRDGDSELYRMPVAGGAARRLTAFHKDDWDPVPSPDGTTLAFASDREGPPRICLIDPDGTRFRRLTTRAVAGADRDLEEGPLRWSPDGTRIAYVLRGAGRGQLVVRVVGSGAETIVTPASASDAEPVFSHDGTWIAVIRTTGRASELVAIPVAGGDAVTVARGAPQLPRWF